MFIDSEPWQEVIKSFTLHLFFNNIAEEPELIPNRIPSASVLGSGNVSPAPVIGSHGGGELSPIAIQKGIMRCPRINLINFDDTIILQERENNPPAFPHHARSQSQINNPQKRKEDNLMIMKIKENLQRVITSSKKTLMYFMSVCMAYYRLIEREELLKRAQKHELKKKQHHDSNSPQKEQQNYWKDSIRRVLNFYLFLTSPGIGVLSKYLAQNATKINVQLNKNRERDVPRDFFHLNPGEEDNLDLLSPLSPQKRFFKEQEYFDEDNSSTSIPTNFILTKTVLKLLSHLFNFPSR